MSALVCYASVNQRPRKMCNCAILDVTVKKILITAFLKNLPFLAKGLVCGIRRLSLKPTQVLSLTETRDQDYKEKE